MGMDVYGETPTSEKGEYFRNNIWWWHPLWHYCEQLAPDLIPGNNFGHSNDGWGLNRRKSLKLADRLASRPRRRQDGAVRIGAQAVPGIAAA